MGLAGRTSFGRPMGSIAGNQAGALGCLDVRDHFICDRTSLKTYIDSMGCMVRLGSSPCCPSASSTDPADAAAAVLVAEQAGQVQ